MNFDRSIIMNFDCLIYFEYKYLARYQISMSLIIIFLLFLHMFCCCGHDCGNVITQSNPTVEYRREIKKISVVLSIRGILIIMNHNDFIKI